MTVIQSLQRICVEWGARCFGTDHMTNKKLRALRFLEEAVELAQACGVTYERARQQVDEVYKREPGYAPQEIGGCMVTLSVLSAALTVDLETAFEAEVRRCLSKDTAHFSARNKEKLDLGLTA